MLKDIYDKIMEIREQIGDDAFIEEFMQYFTTDEIIDFAQNVISFYDLDIDLGDE